MSPAAFYPPTDAGTIGIAETGLTPEKSE